MSCQSSALRQSRPGARRGRRAGRRGRRRARRTSPLSLGSSTAHCGRRCATSTALEPRAGKEPSTRPGTATTSHSRPLAAWTVSTWTASGEDSMWPSSRPRSSLAGGLEPAEEAGEGGPVGAGRERAATSAKASRWARAAVGGVLGAGQHLDVEAESALGLADEVGERQAGERAQAPDDLAQPAQPLEGRVADRHWPLWLRQPGRRQVVERLDDAGPVGAVGRLVRARRSGGGRSPGADVAVPARRRVGLGGCRASTGRRRPGGRTGRAPAAGGAAQATRPSRSAGPSRHSGPVSSRISWSPRVGSCTTQSSATRSLDLRGEQQPTEADHLDGEVPASRGPR